MGEWLDGRREGKGVMTWPDGTRFSGTWAADKREG